MAKSHLDKKTEVEKIVDDVRTAVRTEAGIQGWPLVEYIPDELSNVKIFSFKVDSQHDPVTYYNQFLIPVIMDTVKTERKAHPSATLYFSAGYSISPKGDNLELKPIFKLKWQ